ncbi:KAP family P-loop NTPase fold protein [Microbulbifer sp. PSTR4-B]|uniref:KAP family P-loop NTPase fold protein n=1 Tax=Microbulbifer sp. PSTR4-B TaxID=3243396 RepID=UPI0040391A13
MAVVKIATVGAVEADKITEKVVADAIGDGTRKLFEDFQSKQTALKKFKESLSEAITRLPQGQEKLIIFIDELDRCKPTFAIDLLEMIKHLFNLEKIIFVVAVNREQLDSSIKGVYGNEFDGHSCLDRFFDFEYQLAEPERYKYIEAVCVKTGLYEIYEKLPSDPDLGYVESILHWLCERFSYTLRDTNRIISRLAVIIRSIPDYNHRDIELIIVMLFLKKHDEHLYKRYLEDKCTTHEVIKFLVSVSFEYIYQINESNSVATAIGILIELEQDSGAHKECLSFWEEYGATTETIEMARIARRITDLATGPIGQHARPRLKKDIHEKITLLQRLRIR